MVPSDAADVGPKTCLQLLVDEEAAAFGAEDAMEQAAGKRMAQDDRSVG
jgi:hypothetical protein